MQPSYSSSPRWSDNSRSSAYQWLNRAWPARKALRDVDLTRNEYEELPALRQRPANKPLEWTGHLILSASPPQAPCLPLRGSVGPTGTERCYLSQTHARGLVDMTNASLQRGRQDRCEKADEPAATPERGPDFRRDGHPRDYTIQK